MKIWRIAGRCFSAPPPHDWAAQLAQRLGQRPRRLGRWAELALHGARRCLDDAGEATLPDAALLSVSSVHGPDRALRAALEEARDDLPLPIGFLQSQPGQLLPALALHLGWHGDGRCLTTRDPLLALHLALRECDGAGALLGWVAEEGEGESCWLRLVEAGGAATKPLMAHKFSGLADPSLTQLATCRTVEGLRLLAG